MHSILLSGSVAYDHIMNFQDLFRNHFIEGKLHNINVSFNIQEHSEHFGGTAGNIAYTLALLGEKPALITTAGNDFERYKKHLLGCGIDLSLLHTDTELATAFAYILTDQGDNQITAFYPGAMSKSYGAPIPEARLGIISPGSLDDMHTMPDIFTSQKTPFFFDPGQVIPVLPLEDLKQGIQKSEVVFTNDYEFSLICKRTGWSATDILANSKKFVITMGAEGTKILTSSGGFGIPGVKVDNVVDPTGAGDAYRAGYAKGYLLNLSVEKCVMLGSCAASYAIQHVGTQSHHFTMEEFKKRYEDSYKEACPIS